MAKIIELSGCNGVGKSTLYNELKNNWQKNKKWTPSHYLLPKRKIEINNLQSFIISCGKKFINNNNNNLDYILLKKAEERFVIKNKDFIDKFYEVIINNLKESYNGVDVRFESVNFFYFIISKIQCLIEDKKDIIAIVDEGIIHQLGRIIYKNPEKINIEAEIYELMDTAPLPDALIYVFADIQTISSRLMKRNHITTIHKNLDMKGLDFVTKQSLERRMYINSYLIEKGIPICNIDASHSIKYNTKKIIEFCENYQ